MKIPTEIPELGFYYHYKHDPNGPLTNYAYELVGVGVHTEDDCREEDANMAVYRPLYETSPVYEAGRGDIVWLRPLSMWTEEVEKEGKKMPRFQKITDFATVAELTQIRDRMYSTSN